MPNVIQELFGMSVPHGKLSDCIHELKEGLRSVQETAYHRILGRDFLHHLEDAAEFLSAFFRATTQTAPIGAMYFEMNGFEINAKSRRPERATRHCSSLQRLSNSVRPSLSILTP